MAVLGCRSLVLVIIIIIIIIICICTCISLPVRFGGLGVSRPQCYTEFAFFASRDATQVIVQALHGSRAFEADRHEETILRAHKDFVR